MATMKDLAQQTVSPVTGETFDQGLSAVKANNPNTLQGSYADLSPDTRQLIAENVSTQLGSRDMLQSEVAQRFIKGEFGDPGSVSTPPVASTPVVGGASTPTSGGVTQPTGGTVTSGAPATGTNPANDFMTLVNERYANVINGEAPLSEEQILQNEMSLLQGRIDAINKVYDERVRREEMAGRGRLGQTRALSSVSGTLFDPFGASMRSGTEAENQKNIEAINAERSAEIQSLMGVARNNAREIASENTRNQMARTEAYISAMAQATGMQQDEIQAVRQNALAIAGLTGRYNGQATLDQQQIDLTLRKYLTDVAQQAQENKRANQELELRVQQAARDGKQIDMMPDGTLVAINLDDLSVETLGNYAKVSSGGGGGGSSGGGGGTYSSGVGGADLTPYALDAYERTVGANAYRSVTDSDIPMLTDLYTQRYYNAGYLPPNQYYGPAGGNIGSFNPFTPTPSNSSAGVNLDDLLGGTGVQL